MTKTIDIIERGLSIIEYEPQLARKTIVQPPHNHHYSINSRGRPPRGVAVTRGQVSVPCGVNAITNSSRYNAQWGKISAIALTDLVRSIAPAWSLCQLDEESSETNCAFSDKSSPVNDLGHEPARSCALARGGTQLERCDCPILYPNVNFCFP